MNKDQQPLLGMTYLMPGGLRFACSTIVTQCLADDSHQGRWEQPSWGETLLHDVEFLDAGFHRQGPVAALSYSTESQRLVESLCPRVGVRHLQSYFANTRAAVAPHSSGMLYAILTIRLAYRLLIIIQVTMIRTASGGRGRWPTSL